VRDHGGTAVGVNLSIELGFDLQKKETIFTTSDIGWVVGHSYIVYGPLLRGATTIMYEGKPNTPNPGAFFEICERRKVKVFYTSPTAARFLRKLDPTGEWPKKYDLSSVKVCGIVGERTDIHTYDYIKQIMPEDCLYNDTYWQTETGWFISANFMKPERFPTKGGSCTKPYPGYDVQILKDDCTQAHGQELGNVVIKLPLPPGFMYTLWNNDAYYVKKYMEQFPSYYCTSDSGYFDAQGYLNIMCRNDDIINTAGHRLSTAAMEEIVISHSAISESAVVGAREEIKGEIPVGFIVIKEGH
jgi:propionyl-CoA synthetase